MKIKIFFSLFTIIFSAVTRGESELESRPCSKEEIIGKWEMIYQDFNPNLFSKDDLFVAPHQMFQFFDDGFVKNLASYNPIYAATLADWELAPKSVQFEFKEPGVLFVKRSPDAQDFILVYFITNNFNTSLF